jgi:predicted Zn-dependent protease
VRVVSAIRRHPETDIVEDLDELLTRIDQTADSFAERGPNSCSSAHRSWASRVAGNSPRPR